jgi:hypothetical protein
VTAAAPAGTVKPRALAAALLMLGMLWSLIMLMQDFDLRGQVKAVMIVGLAAATELLMRAMESREMGRAASSKQAWMVAVLVAELAVFAAFSPSHLTTAETGFAFALAAAPLLFERIAPRLAIPVERLPALLALICAALVLDRLRTAVAFLHFSDMEDIGRTTIAAVHAVLAGHNPYATPLDIHPEYPDFPGYKYLPMMIAVFAPLSSILDQVGLRLTNLILDGLMTGAVLLSARRMAGPLAGWLAAFAWLMLPVIPRDLYKHGVTDLAPVLPLVIALAISGARPGRAGLLIGLSVAAKLFPGLLVALCCLRRAGLRYYILGGIVGILPAVAAYFWEPEDFTRNVFLFILSRPIDETSWMFGLAPIVPTLAKAAYFLFLLAVLIHLATATPGMVRRCGLIVLCIIGALLTGPDAHNNYIIWWAPFFCILLGAMVSSIIQGATVPRDGERV